MNKIEINKPKISLINCIGNPPNYPSKKLLAITDSGANIRLAIQSTTTMAPVIISNDMTAILVDGSTMYSSHILTLQLTGLR